jgi:hypothetical protein
MITIICHLHFPGKIMINYISSLLTKLALVLLAEWNAEHYTFAIVYLGCREHTEKALRDLLAGIWAITRWRGWGMLFALSQVRRSFQSLCLVWNSSLSLRNLTPSFVHYSSSAPGDWVNCGLCGEWAHFGCDRRQGLGTFKVKTCWPITPTPFIITSLICRLFCRITRRRMGWNTFAPIVV